MGVAYSVCVTPGGRLLKRSSDEADRPALFAAQFALSHVCWLIAYPRSEEHTSELQSLMRSSYAVFCLKKKNKEQSNEKPARNNYSFHSTAIACTDTN